MARLGAQIEFVANTEVNSCSLSCQPVEVRRLVHLRPVRTDRVRRMPSVPTPYVAGRTAGGRKNRASATAAMDAAASGTMNKPLKSVTPPLV